MQEINAQEFSIYTRDLTKIFDSLIAVDHITMEVKKGELFGLVGPDGAGKTTVMRLLAGILKPTSGNAWVSGYSIVTQPERLKTKIAYMSQRFGLYGDLTVLENLNFYADLFEVSHKERETRIKRLFQFSGLEPFQDRLAQYLSGGMKQKLGLSCALIHSPEVLLLDEPTMGVDPVSRRDFWHILYDLLKEGVTIFVSTAYLDEAERCNRVGFIHQGRLLKIAEPETLKETLKGNLLELSVDNLTRARDILKGMEKVQRVSLFGEKIHLVLENPDKNLKTVTANLEIAGISAIEAKPVNPSLEDIFISMIEEEKHE